MKGVPSLRTVMLLALATLVSCGMDQAQLQLTVEHELAQAIDGTLAALPEATAQPTLTARPTYTPPCTPSVQPTYTPAPTLTPWPSYTPRPTYTPLPTYTPTSTPTPSPTWPPPPPATRVDARTVLTVHLKEMRLNLGSYGSLIPPIPRQWPWSQPGTRRPDCPVLMATYNAIVSPLTLQVDESDPDVYHAYQIYLAAVDHLVQGQRELLGWCEAALTTGQVVEVNYGQRSTFLTNVRQVQDMVHQALTVLGAE